MTTAPPITRFAGLPIRPVTVDETLSLLAGRDMAAPFAAYITPNVEFVYLRRKNADMAAEMERAFLCSNDSRILHRLGSLAGLELKFSPGSYVVRRLFEDRVIQPDDPITIVGVTEVIVGDIRERFGLTNLHHHIPPMGFIHREDAVHAAVDFVAAHPARFVFVAMGPPQSERFCHRLTQDGRATGLGLCIGSSLLVLSGRGSPAPAFMEKNGLVWLYRLAMEPGRLWRRYLINDLQGLAVCLADILAIRLRMKHPHA
jgi:exopolysaccharide biosynthesis WecB/TagA/CpsF family protein